MEKEKDPLTIIAFPIMAFSLSVSRPFFSWKATLKDVLIRVLFSIYIFPLIYIK